MKGSNLSTLHSHPIQGVLVYWVTQNITSLAQAGVLKLKPVRQFFGIPEKRKTEPAAPFYPSAENPGKPMSFMEGIRTGMATGQTTPAVLSPAVASGQSTSSPSLSIARPAKVTSAPPTISVVQQGDSTIIKTQQATISPAVLGRLNNVKPKKGKAGSKGKRS